MTRSVAETLGDAPRVTPGHEGPSLLAPWERRMLGLNHRRGYAREIVLSVAGSPVLSARTVSRLDDPALEVIRKLGDRPLAQLLFEDPTWIRGSAPVPLIERASRRIRRVCVWHTLKRPERHGRPSRILVSEFFEPDGLAGRVPPDRLRR
jgi:chorismate-pyruvate lyase